MIIVLKSNAEKKDVESVIARVEKEGFSVHLSEGEERTLVGAIGTDPGKREGLMRVMSSLPYVDNVVPILKPYKQVSRELREKTIIHIAEGIDIGGDGISIMAGPCAVEGLEPLLETARALSSLGVRILRAGAYKPRTSPYSFQGHGAEGLKMLAAARDETGMAIITEVMEASRVGIVAEYADILQIGTRNMQNFNLLKECGRIDKPVFLKRGMSGTIEEWLLAAEYIVKEGNPNVILCERGIRTFEPYTRNTLDLNAVAAAKTLSHLPVVLDPSHGTGRRELVGPLARAGIAVGADGLMIEAHHNPEEALSDAAQTLSITQLDELLKELKPIAAAVGKSL